MLTHRIVFAAMLLTVTACATATTPEALEAREQAKAAAVFANDPRRGDEINRLCFANRIDSFGETTKRAVVVREGRDYFLIETFSGCFDLDRAQSLAIDPATSCLGKGDRILAFDSFFLSKNDIAHQQSCRVKTIYEWDRDAEASDVDAEDTESEAETVETAMAD